MNIGSDDSSDARSVARPAVVGVAAAETVSATAEPSIGSPEGHTEHKRHVVSRSRLAANFPTHLHRSEFWEMLGRAVATFGFLEETLTRAIFAFTETRRITEDQFEAEYQKWLPTLQKALTDPLGGLIGSYEKAVRSNSEATITNLDALITDLREASALRNVICHGSWNAPDDQGRSLPFYVDRMKGVFETPIDISYLQQLQRHTAELVCAVIDSVTHMGWQFPGSTAPGQPIFRK